MKVSLISLGCPKNLVDSEIILGNLNKAKFTLTSDWKNSDVVIINTCAFLKSAVSEAERWIRKAISYKKKNRIKKIIIAGCLSQRYKDALLTKFPEINSIVGIDNIADIPKICAQKKVSIRINQNPNYISDFTTPRLLTTNHYAYLKIADGCDNYCSYCLIPSIRGRFRSRKIGDIVKEAKYLAHHGVKELILIAQDTTLYGKDIYHKFSLATLLKNLIKIKDIDWIRVFYTHPAHWTDDLIQAYKDNPKICKYVDLPLQHISNKVLTLMNRPYNRKSVENLLAKLRKIPDIAVRTSFIVGFPGETEKDFQELLNFVKEQKFAHLGCFSYSREQGTVAYNLPDQIPEKIKKERYNAIMAIQQKISLKRMKSFVGKKMKVIIDSKSKPSVTLVRSKTKQSEVNSFQGLIFIGRTQFDAPEIDGVVYLNAPDINVGDIVTAKIFSAQPYAIKGVVV